MTEFLMAVSEGVGVVAAMGGAAVAAVWAMSGFPVRAGGAF